jgi:hypothetical protein
MKFKSFLYALILFPFVLLYNVIMFTIRFTIGYSKGLVMLLKEGP